MHSVLTCLSEGRSFSGIASCRISLLCSKEKPATHTAAGEIEIEIERERERERERGGGGGGET